MGSIALMDLKLPSKRRDVSWPSPPTLNSKSLFQNERYEPPSPLNQLGFCKGAQTFDHTFVLNTCIQNYLLKGEYLMLYRFSKGIR